MTSLNAALAELGLLSAVPAARRQYLHEQARNAHRALHRQRLHSEPVTALPTSEELEGETDDSVFTRERKNSEPSSTSPNTSPDVLTSPGSSNMAESGISKGFQVLHMNPTFVANLTLSGDAGQFQARMPTTFTHCLLGDEQVYEHDMRSELVYKRTRVGRHSKRFRKPYEPPWLIPRSERHSTIIRRASYGPPAGGSSRTLSSSSPLGFEPPSGEIGDIKSKRGARCVTPDSVCVHTIHHNPHACRNPLHESVVVSSSSSSCDHISNPALPNIAMSVPRSKSLDELDFNKLRKSEQESQNVWLEGREIDNVSQHLQNLNVGD